jgi:aminoglycoside phosphotransferase (APT) family kinase protein
MKTEARTDDAKIAAWIEKHIGGTIERLERQSRWRGGWWVDVSKNGELHRLYVREERREDFPPWPLEHEASVLRVLGKHGIPAPRVWGICDDPHAIVMDALPGSTSFAGIEDEAKRVGVIEEFAEAVARMHAIDPREAVSPDLPMPETPEDISLGCFKLCEGIYLKGKQRPDPCIEFLRSWIYRNIPRHRTKVSILSVDSGQFMHLGGKVTGLFDMEYACLGDPLIDLASIPGRISGEGGGDASAFFSRYAELTGDTLDPAVIAFHRVWWGLCTPLIVTPNFTRITPDATYFEYTWWYVSPLLGVLLVLADLKGLEIDLTVPSIPPRPSRWAGIFDVMAARIPTHSIDEPYEVTERRKFIEFARRQDAYRHVEANYIAEVAALTGEPVSDWVQADTALEEFVLQAGPEHDGRLIQIFLRWAVTVGGILLDGPGYNEIAYLHRPFPRFSELLADADASRAKQ